MIISPTDNRITWQGAVSIMNNEDWSMPWRIPYDEKELFPPEALSGFAAMPAGVRITFLSTARELMIYVKATNEDGLVDLYVNGVFHNSMDLKGHGEIGFRNLPSGKKLLELWLPHFAEFRLISIGLNETATIEKYEESRPKWITYGSSITHCRAAESPSRTWPAIVARNHGLDLSCLGFAGNCHLEPMVARLIRDMPAEFISIKIGINIQTKDSMNLRTLMPYIVGFVKLIREKHRLTPFAVISPIHAPGREKTPNSAGLTLEIIREEIKTAVTLLQSQGDTNLHYVNGLQLFGPEKAHLLPDRLHPNAEGYKLLAENFSSHVAAPIFGLI